MENLGNEFLERHIRRKSFDGPHDARAKEDIASCGNESLRLNNQLEVFSGTVLCFQVVDMS